MSNIVAIVGRPNVGKSTLFNRLIGQRKAIVDETAGVTRDRIYGQSDWNGIEFSVIDTGGYVLNSDDIFEEEIRKQVIIAIEEADVILLIWLWNFLVSISFRSSKRSGMSAFLVSFLLRRGFFSGFSSRGIVSSL